MSNGCWPEYEAPVVWPVSLDAALEVRGLVRDGLALLGDDLLDGDHSDVGLEEGGLPEVGDPAQQVESPVPHGDHSVFGKGDRLAAGPGHGEFGEDDAGHAGLDDDAQDALGRHHDHRERALLSRRPVIRKKLSVKIFVGRQITQNI